MRTVVEIRDDVAKEIMERRLADAVAYAASIGVPLGGPCGCRVYEPTHCFGEVIEVGNRGLAIAVCEVHRKELGLPSMVAAARPVSHYLGSVGIDAIR